MDFSNYELTKHAKGRLNERAIPASKLEESLSSPDSVGYDSKGHFLIKKGFVIKKKSRVLLIAGVFRGKVFRILTVIDSSKVNKYL